MSINKKPIRRADGFFDMLLVELLSVNFKLNG